MMSFVPAYLSSEIGELSGEVRSDLDGIFHYQRPTTHTFIDYGDPQARRELISLLEDRGQDEETIRTALRRIESGKMNFSAVYAGSVREGTDYVIVVLPGEYDRNRSVPGSIAHEINHGEHETEHSPRAETAGVKYSFLYGPEAREFIAFLAQISVNKKWGAMVLI